MKNKQVILSVFTFIFFGFFANPTFAQNEVASNNLQEELKMLKDILKMEKRDFFEQNMNIKEQDKADQFWALYREYDNDRATLIGANGNVLRQLIDRGSQTLSVEDNDELVSSIITAEIDQAKLRKKYYKKVKKIDAKLAVRFFELDEFVSAQLKAKFLINTPISSQQAL